MALLERAPEATIDGDTRSHGLLRRSVVAEVVLVLLLVVAAFVVLRLEAERQLFTVDESRWIATSRYFWITFVQRDLLGPDWQPSYVVLTHPPVARYLIGLGLRMQGWSPEQLNGRYDTDRGRQYNIQAGNIPTRDLLDDARRVALSFAVGAVLLLYLVGRLVGGQVAGAVAVVLALANPLLATLWTRALAESILAFWCLLVFVLAVGVARAGRRGSVGHGWPIVLGLTVALASATKLSGGLMAFGLALFALVREGLGSWRAGRLTGFGPWFDAAMAAIIAFILVNPLLYPNPIERTVMLFEHRLDEMEQQAQGTPRLAIPDDPGVRAGLMAARTFKEYGTFDAAFGVPIDGLLAALGLVWLVLAIWRSWRAQGPFDAPLLLLCWALVTFVVSTVSLGYDSSHYFMLPVSIALLFEALALAWLARHALRIVTVACGDGIASRWRRSGTAV